MNKVKALSLVLIFALVFSSCGKTPLGKKEIGVDMDQTTNNLDPQFADDNTAKTIIMNIFEGLVVADSKGEIHPGAAEKWSVSSDGLSYSFKLREDIFWQNDKGGKGEQITAKDFAYGLQRLFNPKAPSPYAKEYYAIKNSQKVLEGSLETKELGINVISDFQLEIQLEEKDDFFIYRIADTPAMPCNENFFLETKGRYGLGLDHIRGNGPFKLTRWIKDDRFTLEQNHLYKGETAVELDTVELFIKREDSFERYDDGIIDIVRVDKPTALAYEQEGGQVLSYDGTVWCIAFNNSSDIWGVPHLRQSLMYSIDRKNLDKIVSGDHKPVNSIYPLGVRLGKTPVMETYQTISTYSPEKAKEKYIQGLEILEIDRIPSATIYFPDDVSHREYLTSIQDKWQQVLSLYITLSAVPREKLDQLAENREFDIILLPLESYSYTPTGLLGQFKSSSRNNPTGYKNLAYDSFIETIVYEKTVEGAAEKAKQGEDFLLSDAVIIPLYTDKNYYAVGKNAVHVDIYPHDEIYRFHPAVTA